MENLRMNKIFVTITSLLLLCCATPATTANTLPSGFVYLKNVAPSIIQDIRYSGYHNFVGRPVKGYQANECILTTQAATQLAKVQKELSESGLSLKVFDCYRPTQAVRDFTSWSKLHALKPTKSEFYPNVNKKDFFKLGYVEEQSGHSRGSTVDLTIVSLPIIKQKNYRPGQRLTACTAPYQQRFKDNGLDMGTGFDCMDPLSQTENKKINLVAMFNRAMLRAIMEKYDFTNYEKEWWHYTLKNESFPNSYFDFPVTH